MSENDPRTNTPWWEAVPDAEAAAGQPDPAVLEEAERRFRELSVPVGGPSRPPARTLGEAVLRVLMYGRADVDALALAADLFTEEERKKIGRATVECVETGRPVEIDGLCTITPNPSPGGEPR